MADEERGQKKCVTKTEKKVFSNGDHKEGYDNTDDDSNNSLDNDGMGKKRKALGTRKAAIIVLVVFLMAGGVATATYFIAQELTESSPETSNDGNTDVAGLKGANDEQGSATSAQSSDDQTTKGTDADNNGPGESPFGLDGQSPFGLRGAVRGVPREPGPIDQQSGSDSTTTQSTTTAKKTDPGNGANSNSLRSLRGVPRVVPTTTQSTTTAKKTNPAIGAMGLRSVRGPPRPQVPSGTSDEDEPQGGQQNTGQDGGGGDGNHGDTDSGMASASDPKNPATRGEQGNDLDDTDVTGGDENTDDVGGDDDDDDDNDVNDADADGDDDDDDDDGEDTNGNNGDDEGGAAVSDGATVSGVASSSNHNGGSVSNGGDGGDGAGNEHASSAIGGDNTNLA